MAEIFNIFWFWLLLRSLAVVNLTLLSYLMPGPKICDTLSLNSVISLFTGRNSFPKNDHGE